MRRSPRIALPLLRGVAVGRLAPNSSSISQTAIPALLFLPGTQGIRLYVRVASFAISMALLVWWAFGNAKHSRGASGADLAGRLDHLHRSDGAASVYELDPRRHRAARAVCVGDGAAFLGAGTSCAAPDHLARLMTLLLICNGVNAFVGVLQVYDPARWMPQEMSRLVTESEFGLGAVTVSGARTG